MLKILTYINTAALVVAVGGGVFGYLNRGKLADIVTNEIQKQLPSLVKGAMPSIPSVPSSTGNVLPF
tara:strand:- start:1271 stop:1471 length:201 start_codon:yes stop_codon:yes gene_type:complete